MNSYELGVVLHPDLEIDVDAPIAKIEKIITDLKGTITKRDNWGKKKLAYPIKKQQFGIYVFFIIKLAPDAVRELETQLRITEEVIRFLNVNEHVLQRPRTLSKISKENKKPAATAAKE